jgi:cyclopropane fatty-acyl-phospholipid synthase-like methyltransferase
MGLELYAEIEPLLGFEEAIDALHESYIQILESWKITSLLDIGCGSGKFLAKAQKRLKLTRALGIDLSEKMVETARMRGVEAKAVDLCEVKEQFDAATAVFDVLNYIHPSELKGFMNCAADTLRSGGLFIADVNTLFGFEEVAQGSLVRRSDDYHLTLDSIFEDGEMRTDIDYFTRSDDEKSCWHRASDTIVQYYHPTEALAEASERLELIQSYPLQMYAEEADKEILVFRRV